jgi:hypothetical protein
MGVNSSKKISETREPTIPLPHRFPDDLINASDPDGKGPPIPTVIRYNGGVANSVRVTGDFINWDKQGIPLNRSGDDFYVILNLQKGEHEFKFLVDGKYTVDTTQPTASSNQGVKNVVTVTDDSILGSSELDDPGLLFKKGHVHDDDGYGQEEVVFEETRKFPPLCPPHLRYTPLNSSPQKRSFGEATASAGVLPFRPSGDPCVLPMPLHVTVNHVYFQRREGYSLMGTTSRYKAKYCTVVFYKPDAPDGLPTRTSPLPVPGRAIGET